MKNKGSFSYIRLFISFFLLMNLFPMRAQNTQTAQKTPQMISKKAISENTLAEIFATFKRADSQTQTRFENGVRHLAGLWRVQEGDSTVFRAFCEENFIQDQASLERVYNKVSRYMEALYGHFNEITLQMQYVLHEKGESLDKIDPMFGAYNPGDHLLEDFYNNQIGHLLALNFPSMTLEEKEALGPNRLAWAYARLGDLFTQRVPSSLVQARTKAESEADVYISSYNVYMGKVLDPKGKQLFSEDKILLTHWNLRDEIKAAYAQGKTGKDKQEVVYEVMKRIVDQQIPKQVINRGEYLWDPFKNVLSQEGKKIEVKPETDTRYQYLLNSFHAMQAIDAHTGNTYLDRAFNQDLEISLQETKDLFRSFLAAPEMKLIGQEIAHRLGRKLEAYDIWYDGFKSRSMVNESYLDSITRRLYPSAAAFSAALPGLLQKLGFSPTKAEEICHRVEVDPARGSGHAWGAQMKGQNSHLRTRIAEEGMDYKGYNIAIHEFGHNVEQTLSLYNIDYYFLSGVPNTAFTEALAFLFQKKDLYLLGLKDPSTENRKEDVLDKAWSAYEIMGVSLLDIAVWEWMYLHPKASAIELREAVLTLSKDIWNAYYAPVFGIKDQTILAVYSHMICYPLYLSAYSFGQLIEFQLGEYLAHSGKPFASEIERIYTLGRLTPQTWMKQATGQRISAQSLLQSASQVLKK